MCLEVVGNFQEKCLGKIQLQTPTATMRRVVDANWCGRSQSVFSILGLSRCSWGQRLTSVKDLKRCKGIRLRASLQKGFVWGQFEVISGPVSPRKGTAELSHPWMDQPGWCLSSRMDGSYLCGFLLTVQNPFGNLQHRAKRQDAFLFLYTS